MRRLYYLPLCPFSRKVRLALKEKKLDFDLEVERVWERRPHFLNMNPAGQVPVFQDMNGTVVVDSQGICEYLEEAYPEINLMGKTPTQRAETRRLVAWFDQKFNRDVTNNLVFEKVFKKNFGLGGAGFLQPPDWGSEHSSSLRIYHMACGTQELVRGG